MFVTEATQYCVHGGLQQLKGSLANFQTLYTTQLSQYLVILYLFLFIIFLLSFTELSSEIKALDLRLSDTLLHNLIKIGDLVAPQSEALRIMSMVMKDVSPKWRMMFIRKLFQAENAHLVLPSLPLFIHNFGPICHPLVKELLSDEKMNTEASRQLSKVSSPKKMCQITKFETVQVQSLTIAIVFELI